jgi:hypothetical protein
MTGISRVSRDDDEATRKAALEQMKQLYRINQRWNLPGIQSFIVKKQKELMGW